jgi:relaxase-like protein/DNA relaxase TraI-like protein
VIAETSSGRRFAALAHYLLHGRSGEETERVAWTAGRNLGTDDPEVAAALMQNTAARNERVEAPVYHLTISFDPHDSVTPEQMQAVADRVLRDLGLAEHQAVLVAHQDRAHPHVHIMVNRVHPETGVAWDRWQDQPQIQRALRELERELGLREVAGRLYQLDGQEPPERAALTNGERRQAERTGDPAFPDRVRAHLAELRAARSWAELEARLAEHGLRLERKGQGLVITDGEHQVKASRVARELSLRQLEARFGIAYPDREPPARARERARSSASPAVERVREALKEHEEAAALRAERDRVEHDLAAARDRRQRLDTAMERVQGGSERFDAALARVYRDPVAARESFARTRAELGIERASALLEAEPERYGALRSVERPRAFGLVVTHDDAPTRAAAPGAAFQARELAEAKQALGTLVREHRQRAGLGPERPGSHREPLAEVVRAHAAEVVTRTQDRLRQLQHAITQGPSLAELERTVQRLVRRLEPHELTQLRRMITSPQAAIAFSVRRARLRPRGDLFHLNKVGGLPGAEKGPFHASGHIDRPGMEWVIETVNPKKILPDTQKLGWFEKRWPENVVRAGYGEAVRFD